MSTNSQPAIIRSVLTVKHKEYLTPHYIKITLTGDEVLKFANTTVGVNNKIFIAPDGINEIHFPKVDEAGNVLAVDDRLKPFVRTYTHRGINADKKEMYIEFVAHGDEGPASAWAISAKPGDKLGVAMKDTKAELYPKVDWYLLVADATGIPVIASILEDLPKTAKAHVFIEVQDKADFQFLQSDADVNVEWLYHPKPGENNLLFEAVQNINLPDASVARFAYVAAEFSSVKNIRQYLRKDLNWQQQELYAYSYWKHGASEDGSVKDRQKEKNDV